VKNDMAKRGEAVMERRAFLNLLRQGRVSGAWLFEGSDDYLQRDTLRLLRAQVLPEGMEAMNETVLSAPGTDALMAACETMPFLADQRLVVVEDQAGFGTTRAEADERLMAYLPKVPAQTVLVFVQRGPADRRKKLTKALMDLGHMVSFEPMDDMELTGWITAQFAEQGKQCSPAQARQLMMIAGRDTQRLWGEIGKLSAMAGGAEEISRELIMEGASATAEYTVFQMVDAVVGGRQAQAFSQLQALLRQGESRLGILALLLRQYRMLQHLKIFQMEHLPEREWADRLGVRPFAVENYKRQAAQLSNRAVAQAVALCLETEYRVKSGAIAEEGCLEAVMLGLMAAGPSPRA
jgi:DNA polymerase-3 subunit delta